MQDVRRRPHQVPLDEDEPRQEYVKCVVIGDTAVGKTRLICSHVYEEHGIPVAQLNNKSHLPTVFAIDQYMFDPVIRERSKYIIDGVHVCLRIWDTFGDHEKNRKFAYQNAHVIVLCFSIGMFTSLRNINARWFPEIRKYCPRTPVILVGTQLDRRHTDPHVFKTLGHARLRSYLAGHYNEHGVHVVAAEELVPPEVGRLTSREIGAYGYYETSIVTRHGVSGVFENAIRAALVGKRNYRPPLFSSHVLKRVDKPKLQEPYLPHKPEAPSIRVPPSEYREEYRVLLRENEVADIVFLVGGEAVYAHSILLMTSCPVFACLLTHPNILSSLGMNPLGVNANGIYCNESYINGVLAQLPRGFVSVDTLCDSSYLHCKLVVKVSEVNSLAFKKMLQFLYTGEVTLPFDESELFNLATYLQVSSLAGYCQNLLNGEVYQNIEVCKESRRHMIAEMYKLFYNRSFYSDVTFTVDDTQVPAHKAVLVAHCQMMAAMFKNGHFRESGTSITFTYPVWDILAKTVKDLFSWQAEEGQVDFPDSNLESFLAVLEYLYTGNCSALHLGDPLGTLALANFLCLPRLVALCEQHIVKQVDANIEGGSAMRDIVENIFAYLNTAELHNAPQLAAWCLHYIACNYNDVCRSHGGEVKKLNPTTLKYLEKHRWPPVWYLKEYDYYVKESREIAEEKARKESERHKRKCKTCFWV